MNTKHTHLQCLKKPEGSASDHQKAIGWTSLSGRSPTSPHKIMEPMRKWSLSRGNAAVGLTGNFLAEISCLLWGGGSANGVKSLVPNRRWRKRPLGNRNGGVGWLRRAGVWGREWRVVWGGQDGRELAAAAEKSEGGFILKISN